jgi:hypothetical protein
MVVIADVPTASDGSEDRPVGDNPPIQPADPNPPIQPDDHLSPP